MHKKTDPCLGVVRWSVVAAIRETVSSELRFEISSA